ncbi:unnamed protein product [Cunninghamella echinulata]
MDSTEQLNVNNLPPSAQLALLHAQAKTENNTIEEPVVPSQDDPVVEDSFVPLIAGDHPTPIGQPIKKLPEVAPAPKKKDNKLNLSSESAFPTLSSGSPRPPVISSGWSSAASRVKARPVGNQVSSQQQQKKRAPASGSSTSAATVTDVLELPASQQIANQPNKPLGFKSAADVINQVTAKTGANIIASTNRSGTTTFLIQGLPANVAKAKKDLVTGLVVKRTVELAVPASTRRFIIGTKGKTLQQIEQLSGTRINIPPRKDDEVKDEENEESVNISIVGDVAGIKVAKAEIEKIVGEKAAKQTIKIDNFDPNFNLFISGAQNNAINALEEEFNVKIQMPPLVNTQEIEKGTKVTNIITVTGDKEKVLLAKQALETRYAEVQKTLRTVTIGVPKAQHKFLFGKNGSTVREILEQTGCTVELPSLNDPSDNVTIRGPEERLINGLTAIMEKAREFHVMNIKLGELHKSLEHGQHLATYLHHKGTLKKLESDHQVQITIPRGETKLEIVSKNEKDVSEACKAAYELCSALGTESVTIVNIEPHLHRHINLRLAKQIQRIKSRYDVAIIFPDEKEDSSSVLVVYENSKRDGEADVKPQEVLNSVTIELQKIASDSSDIVSKVISIPNKYHSVINGPKGTTLNAIIGGDDSTVTVRFGGNNEDDVTVRGLNNEVKHVIEEIKKIHEAAKHEEFVNSYSVEFTIPAAYSAHVIGKAGANINKLKEDLGVKIDIGDNNNNKLEGGFEAVKTKKKDQQVKVVIQGIKTNVEAAKDRVSALVANLADQVTLSLNIPKEFHRFLIGPSGRYVKKLEDKYSVFVKFPKGSSVNGDESPVPGNNPNVITIRGRKKDAASAKDELTELYEYEKEELAKRKEREAKYKEAEEKRKAAESTKTNGIEESS